MKPNTHEELAESYVFALSREPGPTEAIRICNGFLAGMHSEPVQKLLEALKFYADKSNWVSRTGRMGVSPIDTMDRDKPDAEGCYPWAGGKLARKVIEEWEGGLK